MNNLTSKSLALQVGMYYEGRLKTNNKKFDACQSGKPFKFRLGHGEVIKGWDLGVEGMKVSNGSIITNENDEAQLFEIRFLFL